MGHHALGLAVLGAAILTLCVGLPQIPTYSVYEVNEEVFDEVDNVETTKGGSKYIEDVSVIFHPLSQKTPLEPKVAIDIPQRLKELPQRLKVKLIKSDTVASSGNTETKYVKVQEQIVEDGISPADVAGDIAFEVLDEVGDHLGSRGSSLKKMEKLLKAARGGK